MKKTVLAGLLLTFSIFAFSQTNASDSSWKTLEYAQVAFDCGNYGEALRLANKASAQRKAEIQHEYNIMEVAITPKQVQRVGSEFVKVLPILEERGQKEAIQITNKYLKLYGKDFFKDDINVLTDWIKEKGVYPECDYLLGQIYQVEGEYSVSYTFYQKALSETEYLDIPDSKYEILYSMAQLNKLRGDKDSYEKTLLLILDNDQNYKNKSLLNAIVRTIKQDKVQNVDRLFMLYRAESKYSLKALADLSSLYEAENLHLEALKFSALGVIEAFTHIDEILKARDSRYKYTTFRDFLSECGKYDDIVEWGQKNNIWNLMYDLGEKAGKNGCLVFSQNFFSAMAGSCPDPYYKALSKERIK